MHDISVESDFSLTVAFAYPPGCLEKNISNRTHGKLLFSTTGKFQGNGLKDHDRKFFLDMFKSIFKISISNVHLIIEVL